MVGRRRRRQDVAANEVAQIVSTMGLESSLRSSDTWTYRKAVEVSKEIPQGRSRLLKT